MALSAGGRRAATCSELKPGDADHADRAGAPALGGEPGDYLQRVVLLALDIFVLDQPIGIAHAGNVDAGAAESVGGEPEMHLIVAEPRAVAPAVRDVLQNGRNRAGIGVRGKEQPRGEAAAVDHRDPCGFDRRDAG